MDFNVFMWEAYKRNLEQKQWPTLSPEPANWDEDVGWRDGATPLLISECARLIIKWDSTKQIFRTHPYNMPNVSIQVIEIVGTIVRCEESSSFLILDVWDGSGIVEVNFDLEQYKAEKERREQLDEKFDITPDMNEIALRVMKQVCDNDETQNSDERRKRFQKQNRLWWEATWRGLYGKDLEVGDYVDVFGFCALQYHDPHDITPWDLGVLPKMVFVGLHLDAIDEETFDRKLTNFIHEGIHKYGEIPSPKST